MQYNPAQLFAKQGKAHAWGTGKLVRMGKSLHVDSAARAAHRPEKEAGVHQRHEVTCMRRPPPQPLAERLVQPQSPKQTQQHGEMT